MAAAFDLTDLVGRKVVFHFWDDTVTGTIRDIVGDWALVAPEFQPPNNKIDRWVNLGKVRMIDAPREEKP